MRAARSRSALPLQSDPEAERGLPPCLPGARLPALRAALIALDADGFRRTRDVRLVATNLSFRQSRTGGRAESRGAADDHRRPTRRYERAIRPVPAKARRPHRRLTTAQAIQPWSRCLQDRPDHHRSAATQQNKTIGALRDAQAY